MNEAFLYGGPVIVGAACLIYCVLQVLDISEDGKLENATPRAWTEFYVFILTGAGSAIVFVVGVVRMLVFLSTP